MSSQITLKRKHEQTLSRDDGLETNIYVCPLSRVDDTLRTTEASHLITLINHETMIETPPHIDPNNHLKLAMNDVIHPMPGMVTPNENHVEELLDFTIAWDKQAPMVVHCWAGISRSTAAAYISLCALNPDVCEFRIANLLRISSPTATPNSLLISLADSIMDRKGRMIEAIETIGSGELTFEGGLFSLPHKIIP